MYCIHFICQFHQWHKFQSVLSSCSTLAHARHAGRFEYLMSSIILMIMDNGRGDCGSPEVHVSQPSPQKTCKLENICYNTNGWITIRVPKWGQISYEKNYIIEHQIWYEIVTYGLRDIYAKFKSTAHSACRYIHI